MRVLFFCVALVLVPALCLARNAALVIIDMQPTFAERHGAHGIVENMSKREAAMNRQRELIRLAKQHGLPILVIEYRHHGATEESILREVGDYADTQTLFKERDGMLDPGSGISHSFNEYLGSRAITELIVCGANGGACVLRSIEGALRNQYRVWVDTYAVIDFNTFPPKAFIHPYRYNGPHLFNVSEDEFKNLIQRENIQDLEEILRSESALEEAKEQECGEVFVPTG